MRNVGLIAFGVTVCVLVPAAVNRLTAGREQVTKLLAPGARTLALEDGAKIDISMDRALVDPGDTIHVKLAASAPTARHVTVGVLVLGATGTEGTRVPSPPVGVAHETVRLDIDATGHATKEIPIRLRGARAQFEPLAHYTILVMPPKAADKLERLRSHARVIPEPSGGIPSYNRSGEQFQTMYWAVTSEQAPDGDEALFAPGQIARLDAHTRPRGSSITITAPDTAPRDGKFTVVVTVKNPGKRPLAGLEVSLDTLDGILERQLEDRYLGLGSSAVTIEAGNTTLDLAGHETKRVEFQVSASTAGVVGLYARASCRDDCRGADALTTGAIEAIEIVETPTVVGAR
jgi:hypothetical protein